MTVTTPIAVTARPAVAGTATPAAPAPGALDAAALLDLLAAGGALPEGQAAALAAAGCEAGLPGVVLSALTDPGTSAVARERAAVRVLAVLAA